MERIVFFGSGPVAAKSLELLSKNFDIEAVVTKPKPAHHRGNFPVLDIAENQKLKVHTVSNKAKLSALVATKPFSSRVGVLIDFGIIVAQDTIDYFPKGIVNSHFSLLPEWRGADPITFALLSGQKKTGVSLMLLVEKMDEGPVIACGVQELDGTETNTVLTDKLINLSDALLKKELPRYLSGESSGAPQDQLPGLITGHPSHISYSRKLTKEDGRLDFNKPAEALEREIRAYSEWPKSYTTLAGKDVIVTNAHVAEKAEDKEIGIKTSRGYLIIDTLKPAGKNEMTAKEFLAGYGKNQ